MFMATIACIAQQSPRSTLSAFHQTTYNPSIVGSTKFGNIQTVVREQYMNFTEDAGPSSVWFNAFIPLSKIQSGVGLSINQLTQGFEKRLDFKANYAYHIDLGTGKLGAGLSVGARTIGWEIKNPIYPDGQNDAFVDSKIANKENFVNLLLGFGVYYKVNNIFTSLAITEMNKPVLKSESSNIEYYNRTYWISGGYEFKSSNPMWIFKPNMLIKTTFTDTQLNFDMITEYNNFIIAGITYTSSHDISPLFGVQFNDGSKFDGLRAIISYDIVTSKIGGQSSGNMEFTVGYNFNLSVEKENKTYKSVRFL